MNLPALQIDDVSAGYDAGNVITNISMSIGQGETFGLIGLNGAGKTTLLKTILGLKDASSGRIAVAGHISGSIAARRNIAFLPERFDPAWFLNAYEFISFSLSLYGKKPDRATVDHMAEKVGLARPFLSKKAQAYSKGMRQKLGLITTFMTGCPVLILDEPMSGLDPLARRQVKDLILSAKEKRITVFLSSHILSDMEELCDRVAILHNGIIRFTGTPSALLTEKEEGTLERSFLSVISTPEPVAA